jgi:hypothetical protein
MIHTLALVEYYRDKLKRKPLEHQYLCELQACSTLLLFATTTVSGIVIKHYYLVDDVTAISASFLFSPFSPFTLPR